MMNNRVNFNRALVYRPQIINLKNVEDFFILTEDKNAKWRRSLVKAVNEHDFVKIAELCKDTEFFNSDNNVIELIDLFTLRSTSEKEFLKYVEVFLETNKLYYEDIKIRERGNVLIFKAKDGCDIKVRMMSSYLNQYRQDPVIQTLKRRGLCHIKSLNFALNCKMGCDVCTSFVYSLSEKGKFLHSWIEANIRGEDVCIDYTLNAIVNRDGYYKINHIQKSDVCRIDNKSIKRERNIINDLVDINPVYSKLYFYSRGLALKLYDEYKENGIINEKL